jgi:hypothetical protein
MQLNITYRVETLGWLAHHAAACFSHKAGAVPESTGAACPASRLPLGTFTDSESLQRCRLLKRRQC